MTPYEIKEYDILQIQRAALLMIANFYKTENADLKDNIELSEIIRDHDKEMYGYFEEFSSAYWNYFYYCKTLTRKNSGILSKYESEKLEQFVDKKEKTRKLLISELEKRKEEKSHIIPFVSRNV